MAEITLDQDQIIKNVNERITQDLAAAIKQVAKDGVWEDAEEDDGIDPEKIIRRTMADLYGRQRSRVVFGCIAGNILRNGHRQDGGIRMYCGTV